MNEDRNTLASAINVIPPSTLSISEEAQLAFSNAPPYFKHFMDLFQKTDARNIAFLHENTNAIKGLATRVDSLENKYEKHSAEYKAEISAVRKDVAAVTAANEAQVQRLTLDDPREIVVRGIPASAVLTPRQIGDALLSVLELSHLAPLVVGWREWTPKPRAVRGD